MKCEVPVFRSQKGLEKDLALFVAKGPGMTERHVVRDVVCPPVGKSPAPNAKILKAYGEKLPYCGFPGEALFGPVFFLPGFAAEGSFLVTFAGTGSQVPTAFAEPACAASAPINGIPPPDK